MTHRSREATLNSLLDVIMDKGVAVDADAKICLSDINLLNAKSHIVLSSFETAKKIGLKFPENTNLDTPSWRILATRQSCPACGRESPQEELNGECPWCGWTSSKKRDENPCKT